MARKSKHSKRRVVTAPYFAGTDGRFRPEPPERCVILDAMGGCEISFHRWRKRKRGPGIALACYLCDEHGCSFTVYPPGWLPYGRRPMVHVSLAGVDIGGIAAGVEGWVETAVGAAVDAAAQRLWPVSAGGAREWEARYGREPYGVRRTQARHAVGAAALFALSDDLVEARAKVAALLGINLSVIAVAAGRARDGPPLVALGTKGAELLSAAGRPRLHLLSGMTRLGADRQYWGPPINSTR